MVLLAIESFRDAVLLAVNLGDDADTTGAVCGQIAGAFYGEEGIPAEWLSRLVMVDDIRSLADQLAGPECADQAPQQTAAAMLVARGSLTLSSGGRAELGRSAFGSGPNPMPELSAEFASGLQRGAHRLSPSWRPDPLHLALRRPCVANGFGS